MVRWCSFTSLWSELWCASRLRSLLGPLLFPLYTASLREVIRRHGLRNHCHVVDFEIYNSCSSRRLSCIHGPVQQHCAPTVHVSLWICCAIASSATSSRFRSADNHCVIEPRSRLKFENRGFLSAAPQTWNSLSLLSLLVKTTHLSWPFSQSGSKLNHLADRMLWSRVQATRFLYYITCCLLHMVRHRRITAALLYVMIVV